MVDLLSAMKCALVAAAGVVLATSANAQSGSRSGVDIPASSGAPEFRDPKTGQIWTPETVGQDGRPLVGPEDKAFNPGAQGAALTVVEQRVRGRPLGTVPVTAGPSTPIAVIDGATLRAVPGKRWQVVLYLDNNSGNAIEPVIECRFTNAGNPVMVTRAKVGTAGAGIRLGLVVNGPRTDVFVDRALCNLVSP